MTTSSSSSPSTTKPSRELLETLLRQTRKALAKTDPYAYIEHVFGYEPAAHHREMVDFVLERIARNENGVILAPRGSSKTTILNTGLLSFLVATRPDIRIGLFSNTDKKAYAMSGAIRWTLSESETFKEVFGDLRSPVKWTDAEWVRRDSRWSHSKDRTMVAAGINPTAVSKRFDLLLLDDVLDEENTYNIDRREKVETWFWKSLKPTLVPSGSIIVIGTRWTEGDLYEKLIDSNGWPSLVIPAITKDEETGEETSYWPEWWPLDRLYKERDDVGWDNFACSYLNDISGLREGTIFKRDWWKDRYFDDLPRRRPDGSEARYVFTMGIDLATSERERADWTTRVIVAEDENHEHWVVGHHRVKTESGHRDFVKSGYDWAWTNGYPVSKIIIETNQHQSTLVQDLLAETNLPVVGKRTDTDKRTRARAVAARYEMGRVHHHRSLAGRELEAEMLGFPKGHDDLIDALGLAMDIGGYGGSFAAVTAPVVAPQNRVDDTVREVRFLTGPRTIPAYLASMLSGIDTDRMTYEEAVNMANRRTEQNIITNALRGLRV